MKTVLLIIISLLCVNMMISAKVSLTVEENITLPLELDNRKVDKFELNEIIKLLGLERRRNHLPNELSGGQQQRVAIGRALMARPSILLCDEPTGNLDTKASLEIMNLLKIANTKYNQTIIMITHDMNLTKYANRIIEIKDGKIVSDRKVIKDEDTK